MRIAMHAQAFARAKAKLKRRGTPYRELYNQYLIWRIAMEHIAIAPYDAVAGY
jgi:hypothetical protein